jgi:hypothetical protein
MARENAEIQSLIWTPRGNYDVLDIAARQWVTLTISSTFDPRGIGLSSVRCTVERIDRTWSTEGDYRLDMAVELRPETFGQPGDEYVIPSGQSSWNGYAIGTPALFAPNNVLGEGVKVLVTLVDENGNADTTIDLQSDSPSYVGLNAAITGNICCVAWDYNSDYWQNGMTSSLDKVGMYAVVINSADVEVHYFADILRERTTSELLHSVTMNDSTSTTNSMIATTPESDQFVVVAFKDGTGVQVVRSTDGGSTWGSAVRVGSSITDSSDNNNAPIGLAIKGATQLVTGPDSTPEYGVYIATTTGGSFSALGSTPRDVTPFPLIKIADSSIAYASVPTTSLGGYTVDFDSGYSDYTISHSIRLDSSGVAAVGNPGNAAQGTKSGLATGGCQLTVRVNFSPAINLDSVDADIYFDQSAGPGNAGHASTFFRVRANAIDDLLYEEEVPDTAWGTWVSISVTSSDWLPAVNLDDLDYVDIVVFHTDGLTPFDFGTDNDLRLDNIIINASGASGVAYQFQRINTYAATPAWSDKSPAANQAPIQPHAASIDRIDPDTIHIYADDGKWYSSSDNGDNWTTEESSSDKRTFDSAGDIIIVGTATGLSVSTDGGTSFDSKDGNLAVADENFDTTKQVLVI